MPNRNATFLDLEPEYIAGVKEVFEQKIVFNRVLGLRIGPMTADTVTANISMKNDLVGHYGQNRLHGGVISAVLDALGGFAVIMAVGTRHLDEPVAKRLERFGKLGTIDLRVDYLRPAIAPEFLATAEVIRLGSRVASTRMTFSNLEGKLYATGAAAYIVS